MKSSLKYLIVIYEGFLGLWWGIVTTVIKHIKHLLRIKDPQILRPSPTLMMFLEAAFTQRAVRAQQVQTYNAEDFFLRKLHPFCRPAADLFVRFGLWMWTQAGISKPGKAFLSVLLKALMKLQILWAKVLRWHFFVMWATKPTSYKTQ